MDDAGQRTDDAHLRHDWSCGCAVAQGSAKIKLTDKAVMSNTSIARGCAAAGEVKQIL